MHITDQRLQTPWQMKLYTKLVGMQFKVIYKPGATNLAVDALSRHPQPPTQLNAISYASPSWLAEVAAGYATDPVSRSLVQELSVDPAAHPPYSLVNGVLRIHDCIWVGDNKPLQARICVALHDSAMSALARQPGWWRSVSSRAVSHFHGNGANRMQIESKKNESACL